MYLGQNARHEKNAEISDADASVRLNMLAKADAISQKHIGTLGQLLDHPALFKNYPELRSVPVLAQRIAGDEEMAPGAWDAKKHAITIEIPSSIRGDTSPREIGRQISATLIHEIQHTVQQIEGMPGGSSPGQWQRAAFNELKRSDHFVAKKDDPAFRQAVASYEAIHLEKKGVVIPGPLGMRDLSAARKEISDQVQTVAYSMYRDAPGEAQARNTASKYMGEPIEVAPKRDVYDLPGAPSTKPAIAEKVSNLRFALSRKVDQIKDAVSIGAKHEIRGALPSRSHHQSASKQVFDTARLTPAKSKEPMTENVPGLKGEYKVPVWALTEVLKQKGCSAKTIARAQAEATKRLDSMAKQGQPAPGVKIYDRKAEREQPREKIVSKTQTKTKEQHHERSR